MQHHTIFDIPVLRNLLQGASIVVLRMCGWRRSGHVPQIQKYVMIAAPHTSNWDFPIGLAIMLSFRIKVYWLGKNSLFRWPFGGFFKWLGGIPVNRGQSGDVVAQAIRTFRENAKIIMAIAPEGTRQKVRYWKTGFYHIACGAKVPIVMAFLDYMRKVGGFGPSFVPTGDIEFDMKAIRDFYVNIAGKYPEKSITAATAPHKN